MRVATAAVRGFALDKASAREVLEPWNARCQPPWSARELEHKIDEAIRVGAMSWGAKLLASGETSFVFRSADEMGESHAIPRYVVPHFQIGEGRPTLIGGFGGVGKTVLAQELGLAVASGADRAWGNLMLGSNGRVVHLDYEMGPAVVDRRYQRLAHAIGVSLKAVGQRLRVCSLPRLHLSSDSTVVEAALLEACDATALAIIDSLRAACPHAKSENDSAMRLYLDILTRVSIATGCAIVVLAHEGKPSGENGGRSSQHRLRGSSAIFDAANTVLSVVGRKRHLEITQTKAVHGLPAEPVAVRIADYGEVDGTTREAHGLRVEAVDEIDSQQEDRHAAAVERAKGAIIDMLRNEPTAPGVRELLEKVKGNGAVKKEALEDLRASGVVLSEPGARGAKLLRLASGVGAANAPGDTSVV
jgi:hypothetical protein